jgi:NADH:ubiquinone oxidoreductase subunit H
MNNFIHSSLVTALARLLIFPGLLFAVPAAWFFLWVERKAVARMQGRIGPPFMQPFLRFQLPRAQWDCCRCCRHEAALKAI